MKRINVSSSNFDSIGYVALMKASSHDSFFHVRIKDKFSTTKVK